MSDEQMPLILEWDKEIGDMYIALYQWHTSFWVVRSDKGWQWVLSDHDIGDADGSQSAQDYDEHYYPTWQEAAHACELANGVSTR